MTLTELCHELNNYFDRNLLKLHGAFEISGGRIVDTDFAEAIQDNQYFRIIGSVFNDGVWKNDNELALTDEVFVGTVWLMAIPKDFIELCEEMDDWEAEHAKDIMSPFQSESFGGYSYSKAAGGRSNSGGNSIVSVYDMFATRLNKWRKI